MTHNLKIERLFSLGNYKNIKIIVEANDISDDVWNNKSELNAERESLNSEIFTNFAIYMAMEEELKDLIKEESWEEILKKLNLGEKNE